MRLKYKVYLIYLICFVDLFAVGLTFPVLPAYLRSLGASHTVVGFLSSVYSAIQVISCPIIGSWSDIKGKTTVFSICLFISAVCYLILGLTTSLWTIFFLRILHGVFKHTQFFAKAILSDLVPKSDSMEHYGKSVSMGSIGFVIGPTISGHLYELQNGFFYIHCLTTILFFVNIWLVYSLSENVRKTPKMINNTKHDDNTKNLLGNSLKQLIAIFTNLLKVKWYHHWISFTLKFLFILPVSMFFISQSTYLRERYDLPQKYVGYIISGVSCLGVIAGFLLGPLMNKYYLSSARNNNEITKSGVQLFLCHNFVAMGICFACFFFTTNMYILIAFLIPFGFFNSFLRILTTDLIFKMADESEKGVVSGASDSIMSLGRFGAPIITGLVSDYLGVEMVMLFAILPSLMGCLISYCCLKYDNRLKLD